MALPNIFTLAVANQIIERINTLSPSTQAQWGKMDVAQMLAHCNVTYEMMYEDKHKKPNAFVQFLLKLMVKNSVVSEKPYKKSGQTAPQFIVTDKKNFQIEQKRLIDFITKTQQLGEAHFDGADSHSFGKLNTTEWNNMMYKHLQHHLTQFGV